MKKIIVVIISLVMPLTLLYSYVPFVIISSNDMFLLDNNLYLYKVAKPPLEIYNYHEYEIEIFVDNDSKKIGAWEYFVIE